MPEVEVEGPADANHRQLEQHEPDTADEQETRQIAVLPTIEESARASEKDESRRDEVRHPACKENPRRGTTGRESGIDADVVDRHQDHDRTPNQIDRRDA